MKPSVKPPPLRVVENANDYNLTDEYLVDFIDRMKFMLGNSENKSHPNITNSTMEEPNPHQAVNCDDYCDNQMRHFFDEYRHYHGYVSLVVSTFDVIKKFKVT